jgi:hypothetical protein
MHESRRRAAEQHELAANAHRTAAEYYDKGDPEVAVWHSERAVDYSDRAYKVACKGNPHHVLKEFLMSARYDHGSHSENHHRAAELHDNAAHAHRGAAGAHEKQDHQAGQGFSRQALEHSQQAFEQTRQAHRSAVNEHGTAICGHEDIAALAYALWQGRGGPEGSPEEDWFHAAQELRARSEVLKK